MADDAVSGSSTGDTPQPKPSLEPKPSLGQRVASVGDKVLNLNGRQEDVPPPAAEFVRPGIKVAQLREFVDIRRKFYDARSAHYRKLERRWARAADILAWLTALLAAFSGISAVTENAQVATGLAVATALAAATNAALNPGNRARRHRTAYLTYMRMAQKLSDVVFFELSGDVEVPMEEVRKVRAELTKMDDDALALSQEGTG